jgi:hypothetical protein
MRASACRGGDARAGAIIAIRGDGRGISRALRLCAVTLFLPAVLAPVALAQVETGAIGARPAIGARRIFTMLFLMLGPIKILMPFVNMTRGTDAAFRRSLATRSALFSAAALAVAALLGRGMLDNFNISLSVLALTGGLILFLVALQTVLQQATGPARPGRTSRHRGCSWRSGRLPFPSSSRLWNCDRDRVRRTGARQLRR